MIERGDRELHTLPDPSSVVLCPLRGHQPIAMGRCVEYQRDNGCHCEHALVALRRTEKHLSAPAGHQSAYDATAQSDALDGVRTLIERAEQIEKARPAIVPNPARNPVPTPRNESASIVPKPARTPFLSEPKKPVPAGDEAKAPRPLGAPPVCEASSCRTALRANNLSGLCRLHRNKVTSRQRHILVPEVVRAAGTARNALEATPAMPAKESSMEEKRNTCSACSKPVRRGHDGKVPEKCFRCRLKAGEVSDHKDKPPRAPASKAATAVPRLPRKPNNVRILAPAKQAAHVPTAPPIFKDLPKIESLPPEYLIACARYLYELRKRIEFALAGEAFHVEHQKPA